MSFGYFVNLWNTHHININKYRRTAGVKIIEEEEELREMYGE